MKKVVVDYFYVREDKNETACFSLTKEINNRCPDGYHYKETIECKSEESYAAGGGYRIGISAIVVFEED